jgi:uroporphyrinogen III methyltransferase/synthase
LPEGLEELGAIVERIDAYRSIVDGTGAKRLRRALEKGNVDLVTFTSASSVRAYVETVGEELSRRAPAASIGPATSEAIAAAGIDLKVEAKESTIDGLVEAIERALA